MNRDSHLIAEMYSHIKEQSPLLNNPMGAAYQGAYQALEPYAAGAVAGAKQLGQNVAGAVTGSQQAPKSPMAAGKQAFSNEQLRQAANSVIQALGLPPGTMQAVINGLYKIAEDINRRTTGISPAAANNTPVNFGGYQQHVKDSQGAVQAAQALVPRA